MKKLILVGLVGLFSTAAFAADMASSSVPDSNSIRYECRFRQRGGKKGGERCEVRGRICFGQTIGTSSMNDNRRCEDGGVSQRVKCSDGFELRDPSIDVFVGIVPPPPFHKVITYAKEDANEAYIHFDLFRVNDKGVRARLTTITDETDVDHYVGKCDLEDGNVPIN